MKILITDVGNSNIVISLYENGNFLQTYRVKTLAFDAVEKYQEYVKELLDTNNVKCVFSSVVPSLNARLLELLPQNTLVISKDIKTNLDKKSIPEELGADILCNLMMAHEKYPSCNVIVADFGTAFTTATVDEKGCVLGVTIAPGMMTSVKALYSNAEQIPNIRLDLPKTVLGKDTVSSIRAGVVYGYKGMLESIVNEVEKETGKKAKLIVTGGFSKYINQISVRPDETDIFHTLKGAVLACRLNGLN